MRSFAIVIAFIIVVCVGCGDDSEFLPQKEINAKSFVTVERLLDWEINNHIVLACEKAEFSYEKRELKIIRLISISTGVWWPFREMQAPEEVVIKLDTDASYDIYIDKQKHRLTKITK
ncbi:MAG: hypothetical protein V1867_01390 [Candidatus Falkowbacteria bacterium]